MKKIISLLIGLMFVLPGIMAYGGGGVGYILPSQLMEKVVNYKTTNTPNDIWTPGFLMSGQEYTKKINKDGLIVNKITLVPSKKSINPLFQVIAKIPSKNENDYDGFEIYSNINVESAEITFAVSKEWFEKNPEFILLKDGTPIDYKLVDFDGNYYYLSTIVNSFSIFELK